MNYSSIVQYGISGWLKDKKTMLYGVVVFVFLALTGTLTTISMSNMIKSLAGIENNSAAAFSAFMPFFGIMGLYVLLDVIVLSALKYVLYERALALKKKSAVSVTALRVLATIVYGIFTFFAALFSVFNLKLLMVGVAGIVLIILGALLSVVLGPVGGLLALVGIILCIVYFFIVLYNCIRLSLGIIAFIEKRQSIVASLKNSWDITRGKVASVILVWILIMVVVWIVSAVFGLPASFYQQTAFSGLTQATDPATAMAAYFSDPLVLLLSIPAYIGSTLAVIIGIFASTALYTELSGAGTSSKRAPAKKVTTKAKPTKKAKRK